MLYNLTPNQKQLLRDLVRLKRDGTLHDGFLVSHWQDPKRANAWINSIQLNNGEQFKFNNINDLDALCETEPRLISCKWNNQRTNKLYSIRQAGIDAVDNNFKKPLSFEDKALIFLQRLYDKVGHDTDKHVRVYDLQGDDFTEEEALQIGYKHLREMGWAEIPLYATGGPDICITSQGLNRIETEASTSESHPIVQAGNVIYGDVHGDAVGKDKVGNDKVDGDKTTYSGTPEFKKQQFTASVWQEDDWWIAQCIEVDVASQGQTWQEALTNLAEALELHFESPVATILPQTHTIEVNISAAA